MALRIVMMIKIGYPKIIFYRAAFCRLVYLLSCNDKKILEVKWHVEARLWKGHLPLFNGFYTFPFGKNGSELSSVARADSLFSY